MPENISRKIGALSFFAMISVVVGHAAGESRAGGAIGLLTLFAVPWFFVVSGYFFIRSLNKYGRGELLRRKVSSLLVPYLLWCLIGWVAFMPIGSGSGPILRICEIFGFAPRYPIANLPLWYVRALIFFMLVGCMLAPILRWPRRYAGGLAFCGLLMMVWMVVYRWIYAGISPVGSPVFFLTGCMLAHYGVNIDVSQRSRRCRLAVLAFAIVACVGLLWISRVHLIGNMAICCAIIAAWILYDFILIPNVVFSLAPVAAFAYFMHGTFIFNLDSLCLQHFPFVRKGWTMEVYYMVKCVLTMLVLVLSAIVLKRFLPRVYAILAGGR